MSTEQPREPEPVALFCGFLRAILDASKPLTHARTSDPAEAVVLGTLMRARELAAGVVSELEAGRGRNAMPLARHLFEEYLVVSYVLDDPEPRLDQYRASEAQSRLDMARQGDLLDHMPPEQRAMLEGIEAAARAKQQAATQGRAAVSPSDRGTLPTLRSMASAVDALTDYRFFYAGVSRYSHPNLSNVSAYLLIDDAGRSFSRSDAPDPPLLAQAGAFAVEYFLRLVRRASATLGNHPEVDSALEELVPEYNARVAVRPIPGLPPRKPL